MNTNCTIIIPVYRPFEALTASEQASLVQTLTILNRYVIQLVCPQSLKVDGYMGVVQANNAKLAIQRFPDSFFGTIKGYNRLLWTSGFYQRFTGYRYLLICQLDAWVFRDELQYWIDKNFDYIGPPVFDSFEKNKDYQYSLFLNGGISLRNVGASLKIIKRVKPLRYLHLALSLLSLKRIKSVGGLLKATGLNKALKIKNVNYLRPLLGGVGVNNEDLKWCWAAETFADFNKPDPDIASHFAFEFHPSYLFAQNNHQLPMACHAWEKYEPEFWVNYIKI